MSKRQFSYLQNGQTVSEQERLKDLLAKDPTAVLSVCRTQLESALRSADSIFDAVRQLWEQSSDAMNRIVELSRTCTAQIPQTLGFFVSETDRHATLKHTAQLLRRLDPMVADLRAILLGLSRQDREMQESQGLFLQAEKQLLDVIGVSGSFFDVEQECRTMYAQLQTAQNSFICTRRDTAVLRTLLQGFCGERMPMLARELSGSADFQNDGKSCSILRVRGLVGELQHTSEETRREVSELFKNAEKETD